MTFGWYHDKAKRIYYLPETDLEAYRRDPPSKRVLQGVKALYTKDRYVIYFRHPYEYPSHIKDRMATLSATTLKDFHREHADDCAKWNGNRLFIPKEPLKAVMLPHLDRSSLVALSLTCKYFKSIVGKSDTKNLSVNALREGHWKLFLWSRHFNPREGKIFYQAAGNNLQFIQGLFQLRYPLSGDVIDYGSSRDLSLETVVWFSGKVTLSAYLVMTYAASREVEIFNWARENHDRSEFYFINHQNLLQNIAAESGQLATLLGMIGNMGLNRRSVFEGAVDGGQIHILEWLRTRQFTITREHVDYALARDKTEIVNWLLDRMENNEAPHVRRPFH